MRFNPLPVFNIFAKQRQPSERQTTAHDSQLATRQRQQQPTSTATAKQPRSNSHSVACHGNSADRTPAKQAKATWDIRSFTVLPQAGKSRFHDFALPDGLMHAIHDLGFEYCTPIQAEILANTLIGSDAIGRAQTGTGKTAAFLISTLKQLVSTPAPNPRYLGEPRAVIIAPTRELALQIGHDALALARYLPLRVVTVVGGMDYEQQRQQLYSHYVDILIATPGRLLDYSARKDLHLDMVETLVIDEADRMLDMGFIPQVRRIVRMTPRPGDRQTLLFSATFTDEVLRLSQQWTWQPIKVSIEPDHVATDTIDQKIYIVTHDQKYPLLVNLIRQHCLQRVIVFTNRRDDTRRLAQQLCQADIKASQLSGEVPQKKRLDTLENFRNGRITVLVATDVAGRGIHIDGISHVINYNLPEDPEDYVHRIGRTGRAGASGTSISFACEDDSFLLPAIETLLGHTLVKDYPPSDLL